MLLYQRHTKIISTNDTITVGTTECQSFEKNIRPIEIFESLLGDFL
jgi:hypothetical protein